MDKARDAAKECAREQAMLGDGAENTWVNGEERSIDEHPEPYLCPDILWRGVFEQVADITQKRTWEVWMGTACALGAMAHRNIHTRYHANLYGWMYGLLVSPTGTGKSVCTDVCKALLPVDYHIDSNIQSGPGLAPILADIERDGKGKVSSVDPHPAIVIMPEWTGLVRNLKIQNSTLEDTLNQIFDGQEQWTISRSEANRNGAGRTVIPRPTLSICATTTASLFASEVTAKMIGSGFLNRYLILPGSHARWRHRDLTASVDYAPLRTLIPPGHPHAFGLGKGVWEMHDQDALDYVTHMVSPLFENELMNTNGNGNQTSEAFKRLHVYAHKIAMLYAWSDRSPLIQLAHVMAAKIVVETSLRFLCDLLANAQPELPAHVLARKNLEELVLSAVVSTKTALTLREICDKFKRAWGYSNVAETVERLVKSGVLRVAMGGQRGTRKEVFLV